MSRLGIYYKIIKWFLNKPPKIAVDEVWYIKDNGKVESIKIIDITEHTVYFCMAGCLERMKTEDVEFIEKI